MNRSSPVVFGIVLLVSVSCGRHEEVTPDRTQSSGSPANTCSPGTYMCNGTCAAATDPACLGPTLAFAPASFVPLPPGVAKPLLRTVIAVDLDGDGTSDVVEQSYQENPGCVLAAIKSDKGTLSATRTLWTWTSDWGCQGPLFATDLDKDGVPEIGFVPRTGVESAATFILRQSGNSYSQLATLPDACFGGADLDGDGYPELLCSEFGSPGNPVQGDAKIYKNDGHGNLSALPVVSLPAQAFGDDFFFGPIGNPAGNRLLIGSTGGAAVISLAAGNVVATPAPVESLLGMGDVLARGTNQLITKSGGSLAVLVPSPDAASAASAVSWPFPFNAPGLMSVLAADLNGDGRPEILASGSETHIYQVLRDSTIRDAFGGAGLDVVATYHAADLDGDGLLDLYTDRGLVYLNRSK